MKSYRLSFGTITIINYKLAEVVVDDGIEMDEAMVNQYQFFLLNNLEAPFSLLVNKKHSYSYTFPAQRKITHLDGIKAVAIVIGTSSALMSTKALLGVNGNSYKALKLFQDREEALTWLNKGVIV
ncbi:hypothetical protein [Flavivirga sp. 57AJ16]|uniref:hypothetical protein n=1 Tax=Flavivirga sp. 57AJ16 TaxID=3025307 RepID=UPI00236547EB|nr:hypothetical protein [Flavivirga sp. 57AJ16]MDD7886514.1 hypothetical protein [Flavivirga sp. 57AJ16]